MTLVSMVTGVSGKQLHKHTTVGRLRNKQASFGRYQEPSVYLTYTSDMSPFSETARKAKSTAPKTDRLLRPFTGQTAHARGVSPKLASSNQNDVALETNNARMSIDGARQSTVSDSRSVCGISIRV